MKALLYKRNHMFAPWMLVWSINGLIYQDSFRTKAEALEYASAMCCTIELAETV